MKLSGAEILVQSLTDHNLDTFFGYQGSCIMQIMDCFYNNNKITHILVRHEQGAVHAACGYAQLANKPGVVLVTSGPGATNTVTGIVQAYNNGIPLLIITGQVASNLLGTDAFQEADMLSITAPITKWNYQIRKADEISNAVSKALRIAVSDRPGPVLLDITKDAQTDKAEYIPAPMLIDYNIVSKRHRTALNSQPVKRLYSEVIRILQESGKDMVLVVDKIPNDFYSDDFWGSNKVMKSGTFNVPGFGLPAAIGAKYATADKMICLIVGELEYQATIKELGIILQQGLDIKMIVFTHSTNNRFEIKHPDLMKVVSGYGIKGSKVSNKENLTKNIETLLNSTESYLLEISEELFENS